ncbi:MAG: TIM-barrel domain-containing protein [Kiritimatiellia bacterium]
MKITKLIQSATIAAFLATICSAESNTVPVWADTTALTEQNVVLNCDNGDFVRIDLLSPCLFRIRHSKNGKWTESALNRYGIFKSAFPKTAFKKSQTKELHTLTTDQAAVTLNSKDGSITLTAADGKALTRQASPAYEANGGYDLRFSLAKDERLYGLGDVSRENIMRRGSSYDIWVRNVTSYIPVPMILSNKGWGMLMNTTWRNKFDVGKTDPDALICTAPRSDLDYYIFCGPDYRSLLNTYTSFTGRPALLPVWGYGFTYVCNENIDAFNLVNEALEFRRQEMPCDVIGLEPGWMEKNYDFTIKKKWHPQRFPFPSWAPVGAHTFPFALKRRGFKLSLWLCCNYDLGVYEEQCVAEQRPEIKTAKGKTEAGAPEVWHDDRIEKGAAKAKVVSDKESAPEGTEPWFEHLKKFVDQGAACFKLDGSAQVTEHPKRKWGNGMTDEEMHNLYPVIYAKQMSKGFEDHAGCRSMIYSAGGYAGLQQFVATWAGDTGGGVKPLASMLNLGFSGHANHSCDMSAHDIQSIHFGFLQTWAQQNNWAYWRQPWLETDNNITAFREYGQLRYKLLPYLYSAAAEAARTGYPVMRPMPLVYADDPGWDDCKTQYMLGDSLLVSAFTATVSLPAGKWIDFWSGLQTNGPVILPVNRTPTRGGALLVKAGAIIPTWPLLSHIEKGWSPEVGLLVYPTTESSSFSLYEDDGKSLDCRKGKFAQTLLTCETVEQGVKLTIGGRTGSYSGMPTTRDFTASIHLPARPKSITLDGAVVTDSTWDTAAGVAEVKISACGKAPRVLMLISKF